MSIFLSAKIRNVNCKEITECFEIDNKDYYNIEKKLIKENVAEISN